MHDILATLTPIYKLMRYSGFASYTVEGPPKTKYVKHSFKYELTSNLVHRIFIGYSTYFYIQWLRQFNSKSMLIYLGSVLCVLSEISFLLITPIFNKIQTKRTISTLTRLYEVDKKFTKIGVRINYNYLYRISNAIVVATFSIFSAYAWTYNVPLFYSEDKMDLLVALIRISFYYTSQLHVLATAQFCVSFMILAHMFSELNRFASTKILINCAGKLRILAAIHQDLCQITRNFNRILSVQTLFIFGTFFVLVTLHVFGVASALISRKYFDSPSVFSFVTAVFYLSTIAIYAIISSQCMDQAGRIKKILFKILTNSDEPALKREVKAFSLQIIHEEFSITAGGFFTINLSLLTTIVGTLITYTTILVQYDSGTNSTDNVINY